MASKPKILWVRTIMSEREEHSQFYVLVRQPQVHDRENFFNYLRMTPNRFEHLLTLVAPFIQKKKCRSRRPLSSAERLVITLCCLATSALLSISTGTAHNRSSQDAYEVRKGFKEHFISENGALPWQRNYVTLARTL